MGWLLPRKLESGWMAVGLLPAELNVVHGICEPGNRPLIAQMRSFPLEGKAAAGAKAVAESLHLNRYRCQTLMPAGDYQLLTVDAPNVPPAELKSAVRWSVHGLIDFHIDDATVDVLDVPADPRAPAAGHSMYAVVARNDVVKGRIDHFQEAAIPLLVIDIAETAQRNIGCLCEESDAQGVALLYTGESYCLLTINFKGELYLSRRIELGLDQLAGQTEGAREGVLNRILVEIQRTLDVFERQYHFAAIAKLVVAPEPRESGIREFLAESLGIAVVSLDLASILDFSDELEPDLAAQWKHFHLIGAVLRQELKAL